MREGNADKQPSSMDHQRKWAIGTDWCVPDLRSNGKRRGLTIDPAWIRPAYRNVKAILTEWRQRKVLLLRRRAESDRIRNVFEDRPFDQFPILLVDGRPDDIKSIKNTKIPG